MIGSRASTGQRWSMASNLLASLLLVAMPGAPIVASLLLVAMSGTPASSVLAPSSDASSP